MIRAYLVDDEKKALKMLNQLLSEYDDVEVVGLSNNSAVALEQIQKLEPDVTFLDIEMPGINGVEMAKRIRGIHPDTFIVFTTAYEDYAITAFEQEALDYLLKPLEQDRLSQTVQRVITRLGERGIHKSKYALQLTVQMFGNFTVYNNHKQTLDWRTSKEKELFALLLLHTYKEVHRDEILHLLWENDDFIKAKNYLHTCISYLRTDLKKIGLVDVIQYKSGTYRLDWSKVDSDYNQFIHQLSLVSQDTALDQLEHILSLYSGPLFYQCDYPWAEVEKERIEKAVIDIQIRLVKGYFQEGSYGRSIQIAESLVLSERYDEEIYLLLMDCYRKLGKHADVIRVRRLMEEMLQELY